MTDAIVDVSKTYHAAVLDRVERGEIVTLERDGRTVATVSPVGLNLDPESRERFARRLTEVRAMLAKNESLIRDPVTPEEIKEWINWGRR